MKRIRACLSVALVAVALLLVMPTQAQARRIALVIGNGAYKETAALTNTRNDATDVSAALKRLQFEVLEGLDLDKRAMERLIRQFDQKLSGADIALFFYAGHGIQVAGQNHLVPVDARLAAEGDIDFESLPLDLILRRMEREAKTSVVLLDACRDNPLARNLARTMGTRSANIGQGLAEVKTGIGTLISFSTQPGNVALDGQGRNSPYATALLKQIEAPDRDVLSMLAAVRGEVVRSTGGKQVPWEHTSLLGPLVLTASASAAPTNPAPAAPATPSPPSKNTEAADAWPRVMDSTSTAVLEAFIRRYSDTIYGDLAKARLADLTKPKLPTVGAGGPALNPPPKNEIARGPSANCADVLAFLKNTGAFGAKPIQAAAYADRVSYFKRGQIGRTELIRIAREYETKYPTRIYEIDDKTIAITAQPNEHCQIKFEYTYLARNSAEERSGRGASEFMVRKVGSGFEIIAETGDILSRDVRTAK